MIWKQDGWKIIRFIYDHEGGGLMMRLMSLRDETPVYSFSPSPTNTEEQTKKSVIYKPSREPSPETAHGHVLHLGLELDLRLLASRILRK